jgi:hypothetical protein
MAQAQHLLTEPSQLLGYLAAQPEVAVMMMWPSWLPQQRCWHSRTQA